MVFMFKMVNLLLTRIKTYIISSKMVVKDFILSEFLEMMQLMLIILSFLLLQRVPLLGLLLKKGLWNLY